MADLPILAPNDALASSSDGWRRRHRHRPRRRVARAEAAGAASASIFCLLFPFASVTIPRCVADLIVVRREHSRRYGDHASHSHLISDFKSEQNQYHSTVGPQLLMSPTPKWFLRVSDVWPTELSSVVLTQKSRRSENGICRARVRKPWSLPLGLPRVTPART